MIRNSLRRLPRRSPPSLRPAPPALTPDTVTALLCVAELLIARAAPVMPAEAEPVKPVRPRRVTVSRPVTPTAPPAPKPMAIAAPIPTPAPAPIEPTPAEEMTPTMRPLDFDTPPRRFAPPPIALAPAKNRPLPLVRANTSERRPAPMSWVEREMQASQDAIVWLRARGYGVVRTLDMKNEPSGRYIVSGYIGEFSRGQLVALVRGMGAEL